MFKLNFRCERDNLTLQRIPHWSHAHVCILNSMQKHSNHPSAQMIFFWINMYIVGVCYCCWRRSSDIVRWNIKKRSLFAMVVIIVRFTIRPRKICIWCRIQQAEHILLHSSASTSFTHEIGQTPLQWATISVPPDTFHPKSVWCRPRSGSCALLARHVNTKMQHSVK